MADPKDLFIRVLNVNGEEVAGAQVAVTVRKGAALLGQFAPGPAPRAVPLAPGFVQVEIAVTAGRYFAEGGELLFNVYNRWASSNAAWTLAEAGETARLDIPLGRVRYAKVVPLPPTREAPPDFTPGGIALDERPQYRGYWPDAELNMMILRRPAKGDLDGSEWKRFAHDPFKIKLGDCGNWLFLEYGDPEQEDKNVRFLLGVWAPHSIPVGTRPAVVVQLTPNPQPGAAGTGYPVDKFPFTGVYPFRMIPRELPGASAKTVPISQMHQRYAELAIDRSLLTWWVVPQIYGARPDLFGGPNGPIVITIVPALTNRGVERAPLSHREGIGRMVAEVLRFLWSRRLTLGAGAGRLRLLFPSSGPGEVSEINAGRPTAPPDGYPAAVNSTILTHSAGVGVLAQLAAGGVFPKEEYPRPLWGGCISYCEADWKGIWLIDGVARNADGPAMYQPAKGSSVVETWKAWVRGGSERRFVAVYCEAGLGGGEENGLVAAQRVGGSAGWIEEAQTADKKISWLRVSNSLLAPTNPTAFPQVTPQLGGRNKAHDDIFTIGIGYAARRAP